MARHGSAPRLLLYIVLALILLAAAALLNQATQTAIRSSSPLTGLGGGAPAETSGPAEPATPPACTPPPPPSRRVSSNNPIYCWSSPGRGVALTVLEDGCDGSLTMQVVPYPADTPESAPPGGNATSDVAAGGGPEQAAVAQLNECLVGRFPDYTISPGSTSEFRVRQWAPLVQCPLPCDRRPPANASSESFLRELSAAAAVADAAAVTDDAEYRLPGARRSWVQAEWTVPVVFWGRQHGNAVFHYYHATENFIALYKALLEVGLVNTVTGRVDRRYHLVVMDNMEEFKTPFIFDLVRWFTDRGLKYLRRPGMPPAEPTNTSSAETEPKSELRRKAEEVGKCAPIALCVDNFVFLDGFHWPGPEPWFDWNEEQWASLNVRGAHGLSLFARHVLESAAEENPEEFREALPQWQNPVRRMILFLVRSMTTSPVASGAGSRSMTNVEEVKAQLRAPPGFEIRYEALEELGSLSEQLALIASATVFIGAHGAGMLNVIYLPKMAVVVELFPAQWYPRYRMYGNIARLTGKIYHEFEYLADGFDPDVRVDNVAIKDSTFSLDVPAFQKKLDEVCTLGVNRAIAPS